MRIITNNSANGLGAETLRRRGFRLTGPRRLILEMVQGTDRHPTADWVHRQVRRRLSRVSLGTVYRNLRLLVEEGMIKELPGIAGPQAGAARFDGNTTIHHHFTCSECGGIRDLSEAVDRSLDRRMAARTGLRISHHRIEFYGRCPACQARQGRRRRSRKRR
ncbi:MAG: transcriptional repressor [Candidatus Rokubacteria bacterium]|nr:transcriptional repressor [Candidatus Rokubacteria bacterium]